MGGEKGLDMLASDIPQASAPHAGTEFDERTHLFSLSSAILFTSMADISLCQRLYFIEDAHFALPR